MKTNIDKLREELLDCELFKLITTLYEKLDKSDLEVLYKVIAKMEREAILKDVEAIRELKSIHGHYWLELYKIKQLLKVGK